MSSDRLRSTTTSRTVLYEGTYLSVYKDAIRLPNGQTAVREIVRAPSAVGIVAIDPQGQVVLVRQYREAVRQALIEIPAGIIDTRAGESPLQTAHRELAEETGYRADRIDLLVPAYYFAEGFCDATMELYFARDLAHVERPVEGDATELVEVVLMPFDEAYARNLRGEFPDAKTKLGLMAAKRAMTKAVTSDQ
ncbi:MAG: NUDIX hydrolase [Candidatus Latescibacteria bacterium]|nr:NUDIX hydrolase [Candidatus Latescibacterota bacterium]